MTTDVELLPLPEGYEKYDPPLLYEGKMFHEGQMRAYARANVTHATAAKDAEIEALRKEVERLRADRDSWEQQASDRVADWYAEHLRAERLRAEVAAWRELSDHVRVGACAVIWPDRYTDARIRDVAAALKRASRMTEALALLPDDSGMVEHNPDEGPRTFCCWQEVKLRGLHDYLITHDKDCWYARMRALREQEQSHEGK